MRTTDPRPRPRRHAPVVAAPEPDLRGLRVLATTELVPWLSCGGSDKVAGQVARHLARWGAEVVLVAAVPEGGPARRAQVEGVTVVGLASRDASRRLGVQLTLPRGIVGELGRLTDGWTPSVVVANGLHFPSSAAAAVIARRRRLPLVTVTHIGALDHLPAAVRAATSIYEHTVGRLILGPSREVIAVSPSVARHVRRRYGPGAPPVTVVRNGVDGDVFSPAPAPEPGPGAEAHGGAARLVFVGRLIANKGPQVFLDALGALARQGLAYRASFVGDGPLRDHLTDRARALGVGDRVTFTGAVRDVDRHLRAADVLVRPSQTEGLPLTVLEAMASGTCVVASDVPGNADLVVDEVSGLLVEPGSVDALAGALARLVGAPALRRRLGEGGLAVAARHSWRDAALGTAEVLRRAAGP